LVEYFSKQIMTRSIVLSFWLLAFGFLAFSSCGPAAEDRSMMMSRSKQVQDSIAAVIRMQMAEAEGPAPVQALPTASPTTMAPVAPVTQPATHTHAPGETHNH
jgi:hypothetical protein